MPGMTRQHPPASAAPPPAGAVPEKLKQHTQQARGLLFERSSIDETARTVRLAFASEAPVERWFGVEILDCTAPSIRLGRLTGGANLLCDHDTCDVVGVVETVEIGADRIARAVIRFGKSARAQEVWQDVVDGIRRNVSVGYLIHKAQLVESVDGEDTYRITDWEPYEISLVSVPADTGVGVGRSAKPTSPKTATPAPHATPAKAPAMPAENTPEQRNHPAEISKIAASLPGGAQMALDAIQRGLTVEEFQTEALRKLATQPLPTADIGLTRQETKRYSMLRILNALASPGDANAQRAAQFERECSNEVAKIMGKSARGFFVPHDVQKRDLTAGVATAGGNTVATELLGSSFIEMLRNAMVIDSMGARVLTGLQNNIAIPKQTGAATAYWVAENAAPAESQQTFGQVTLSPKTVAAFTDISRRLLLQSSIDVEQMVQSDLASVLGLAIQQAAISGSGASNQPSGLLSLITASVVGGANGLAPSWQNIIDLETGVAVGNAAVGSLGYLTNVKVRGKLKSTQKFAGTNGQPIWDAGDMPLNGYACGVTNAVPSNLTKGTSNGVCSAIVFGNFADLIIGMWGSLDMTVDPYTGSSSGTVRVIALQDVDVAVRNVESFATMTDALAS